MNELTVTGTKISTILIVRNDGTTGWKDSTYCLQKGELGIEYLDNGNIIIRSGIDGKTPWLECPQVEGVLENNIKLNYDFGKYQTKNGYVDAGGKDMTVSQWIKSCLQDIKLPAIEQPTYTLSTSTITTDSGNYEIGSKVIKLAWNGNATTGSYEYGSIDGNDKVYTKAEGTGITKSFSMEYSEGASSIDQKEDGSCTLSNPIEIANDSGTALGSITGSYTWSDSSRTPVNNVGDKVEGTIVSGNIEKTATYSVTGYREGFFYGSFVEKMATLTGEQIRSVGNKTSKKYESKTIQYTIPVGAATVFMAWPANKTGVTNILNTTVNANMNEAFNISEPKTVEIGGYNNTHAIDYKIITFTPPEAYGTAADLTITLG